MTATDESNAAIVQAIVGLPMRLRAHRSANDMSLRELSRRTGLGLSTLHRVEHGEDYNVTTLLTLAAYLEDAQVRNLPQVEP